MKRRFLIKIVAWIAAALPVQAVAQVFPAGLWRSDGYGWLVDTRKAVPMRYQLSAVHCIAGPGARYLTTFSQVKLAADGNSLIAYDQEDAEWVWFNRALVVPKPCLNPPKVDLRDPVLNFEAFWEALNRHYPLFEERKIDWPMSYVRNRPRITTTTSDHDLFAIMAEMIAPLGDSHVGLTWPRKTKRRGGTWPLDGRLDRDFDALTRIRNPAELDPIADRYAYYVERFRAYQAVTDARLVPGSRRADLEGLVVWGRVSSKLGYLRIDAESISVKSDPPYAEQIAIFRRVLDRALTDLADIDGLVLDLRYNMGGYAGIALEIAGRFADRDRPLISGRAYEDNHFAPSFSMRIEPSRGRRFTGPIAVLQSRATASSGDFIALAMKQLPHSRSFGERTHGIFSTELVRTLPNGWQLNLSNQLYRDVDGNITEGRAVEADVQLPDHFAEVPTAVKPDLGLDAAIADLDRRKR
jgi:hypothetical protein